MNEEVQSVAKTLIVAIFEDTQIPIEFEFNGNWTNREVRRLQTALFKAFKRYKKEAIKDAERREERREERGGDDFNINRGSDKDARDDSEPERVIGGE